MSDDSALAQPSASHIPVREVSLAIVVATVLSVEMATLVDWKALGAAVSTCPGLSWVQVVALSLLSHLPRFARWHR